MALDSCLRLRSVGRCPADVPRLDGYERTYRGGDVKTGRTCWSGMDACGV